MPTTTPKTPDTIDSVAFVSLGCPKNLVDSEKMLGVLRDGGYKLVSDHDEADAVVINTCGFLEASRLESIEVIEEAVKRKEAGQIKRIIVAGCLVQRHRARILEWAPQIDAMLGVFDRDHIVDAVSGGATRPSLEEASDQPPYWIAGNALQAARDRGINTVGLTVNGADGTGIGYFEDDSNRLRLTPRHWAYLRISEGCNQRCTFCTIPSIRGKMRSKPLDVICSEARQLMSGGAFELNLIGQDTTSYGYDLTPPAERTPEDGLIGLLSGLNEVAKDFGGGWIRLMYVYPTHFTDEMIDAIASLDNICKYIDIPLQHTSDRMLESMRRGITGGEQKALLEKLRERIPGLAIRTTFITGFPGETEEDHQELVEFVESFGFDMMGVFQYSAEDGTPAARLEGDPALCVPDEVKARREEELMLAQQQIAFDNAAFVAEQACQFDVLIDNASDTEGLTTTGVAQTGRLYTGRCYHQAPQVDSVTYVHSSADLSAGELVRCTIVDSDGYDLIARPTVELEPSVSLPVIGGPS